VDHYGSTLFTTDRIKDEHDFHNPCLPTAQGRRRCQYCRMTRPLARPPEGTQKKPLGAAVA
jgi:hypothetical protein